LDVNIAAMQVLFVLVVSLGDKTLKTRFVAKNA